MIRFEPTTDLKPAQGYHITPARAEDLPRLEPIAREFYASSRFLKRFDISLFCQAWEALLRNGTGVIYLLIDGAGEITGTIGGVAYPDLYSGALVATEFFWFVREGCRGKGIELYKSFERWAREKQCVEIRMVHLLDSMPEKLERVYRSLGFSPTEKHYAKELVP
jgi:GNAT superfamily N-acetyltransferase